MKDLGYVSEILGKLKNNRFSNTELYFYTLKNSSCKEKFADQ